MAVEVTDAAVSEFLAKLVSVADPKEVLAVAWEVMQKHHSDPLAAATQQALQAGRQVNFAKISTGECCVAVVKDCDLHTQLIPLTPGFSGQAAATVQRLSRQVRT